MEIIGFYKNWSLVEKNGEYFVVDRRDKTVVFKGDKEKADKYFFMIAANYINEKLQKIES